MKILVSAEAIEWFILKASLDDVAKAIPDLPLAWYEGVRAGHLRIVGDSRGFEAVPKEQEGP